MNRNCIFISDLHLSSNRPETTKLLEEFAANLSENTDAVYFLGDIFQYWAGDDDKSQFNESIKKILRKISAKTDLYLMVGNRDFLLGENFSKESDATLLADPTAVDLYGKNVLLTHGDILCTKDIKYTTFRKIIRIPLVLKTFLKLPLKIRLWIASTIQKISSKIKYNKQKNKVKNNTSCPQKETVKNLMKKHNSQLMIHGHMHKIEIDEFQLENKTVKRICLDEWTNKVGVLFYYEDHSIEFKPYENT